MPRLNEEQVRKLSDFVDNEDRKQWIGSHPRITYLGRKYALDCDSDAGPYKGTGAGTRRRHRRGCKRKAQFKFVALATSEAVSGLYCWTHLSDQINEVTGREKKMFERWANKHIPPWQDKWEEWAAQAPLNPEEPE